MTASAPPLTSAVFPAGPVDSGVRQHATVFFESRLAQARLDAAWQVVQANQAWTTRTGNALGVRWYDLVHPVDLARDLPQIGQLQTGTLPAFRSNVRLRDAEGGWSEAELLLTGLPAPEEGAVVMVLPASASATQTPVATNDDGRQLAAALSHDVRQHARLASVYCSLLARGPLTERQQAQLAVVIAHTERLQQVLNGLVYWLRLADEPLDRKACDLGALWAEAFTEVAPAMVAANDCGDLPSIEGDPLLMGRLLRELVLNAVRYRGGPVRISLTAALDDLGCDLCIDDDGPGIPLEQRERVLLPLHRLHSWEEVPGYGLGLSMAARIAARHGGRLSIDESPAGGCRVQVRLNR